MSKYEAITAYLDHVSDTATVDIEQIKILIKNRNYYMIGGIFLPVDAQHTKLRNDCIKAIYKENIYNSSIISEKEITELLTRMAVLQFQTKQDQTKALIQELEALVTSEFVYVMPNYALHLTKDVISFDIGPVKCAQTESLKALYGDKIAKINIQIESETKGFQLNEKGFCFALPPECFCIYMKCSPKRAESMAQWYVDIALSLFRFYAHKCKATYSHFPHIGDLDPIAFSIRESYERSLTISPDTKGVAMGRATSHPRYEINHKVVEEFSKTDFNEVCIKIFNAKPNSLQERLQRALGWMTKARVSNDLATRFLFFFTAIEALLTYSNKDAPITDTIARNVATIISNMSDRFFMYSKVKELYAIRSQLVHSESRKVTESQCVQLQYYTELVCFMVIDKSLNKDLDSFHASLKEAGFGKEWPS